MKEKRRRKDNPGAIAFGDLSYNKREEGRRSKVIIDSISRTTPTNKKAIYRIFIFKIDFLPCIISFLPFLNFTDGFRYDP